MRHEDRRDAELALQGADLFAQRDADLGVERGERLVEQQDLRLDGERAGEGDALLLAARELIGIAVGELRQLDELEHLLDAGIDLGGAAMRHLEAEGDVVAHRHVGEQRIGLEHHADLALMRLQVGHVLAIDADRAARRGLEAGDHAQDRRLAAAGRAEQGQELASLDLEVGALHRGVGAEGLGETADRKEGHGGVRVLLQRFEPGERFATSWMRPMQAHVTAKAMMASAAGS